MKKVTGKISVVTALLVGTVFLGCSSKEYSNGKFNSEFKDFTNEKFKDTQADSYVKNSIAEVINERKYISFDNTKKLSIVLEELSAIDDKVYMLSPDAEDLLLPSFKNSHKLNISSFDRLNRHIQDTTNYFVFVKDNRFAKDRVKVVSVKNKESFKKNLSDVPFSVDGRMALGDVLENLKKASGFSVVIKGLNEPDDSDTKSKKKEETPNEKKEQKLFAANSSLDIFENSYISFSGSSVMELLDYISSSFNVYVDVDYETKMIVISKLKSKVFNIGINNIEYKGTLDAKKELKNDVGDSAGATKSVTTKLEFDILTSLEKDIDAIIKKSKKGAYFSLNRTVGALYVMADKQVMQDISTLISNFNSVFQKQIDFQLDIYEFAVTDDQTVGVNLGATIKDGAYSGSFGSPAISNSIFNLTKTTGSGSIATNGVALNNTMVKLLQKTSHGYILKNSIPYSVDLTDSSAYVKGVKTDTTTTDNVVLTKSTLEVSQINQGTILSLLSKVLGNKVDLNIEPKIITAKTPETVTVNKVAGVAGSGDVITLPNLSTQTFSSNVILENGEKKVVGHITSYVDTNNYSGIVPIENFVLGGSKTRKYFRKETVFVVSANIRE